MSSCCDSTSEGFCTISRAEDGKLVLTIDTSKLPKQGEGKEGLTLKCNCC